MTDVATIRIGLVPEVFGIENIDLLTVQSYRIDEQGHEVVSVRFAGSRKRAQQLAKVLL